MANQIYCRHCGSPNEYTLTPQKFCGNCAQPLSSAAVKAAIPVKSQQAEPVRRPVAQASPLPSSRRLPVSREEEEIEYFEPPEKIEVRIGEPAKKPAVSFVEALKIPPSQEELGRPASKRDLNQLTDWMQKKGNLEIGRDGE